MGGSMPLACSFACDHNEGKVNLRFVSIASRAVLVWHNAGYQTPPLSSELAGLGPLRAPRSRVHIHRLYFAALS